MPTFGLVTGGTKTSRTASGSAYAKARRESTKENTESCITDLNIALVVKSGVEAYARTMSEDAGQQRTHNSELGGTKAMRRFAEEKGWEGGIGELYTYPGEPLRASDEPFRPMLGKPFGADARR